MFKTEPILQIGVTYYEKTLIIIILCAGFTLFNTSSLFAMDFGFRGIIGRGDGGSNGFFIYGFESFANFN